MSSRISAGATLEEVGATTRATRDASLRTAEVFVLWTTPAATMSAAKVGHDLAAAMWVPLTLVRFCPFRQGGLLPVAGIAQRQEIDLFVEQLSLDGIEVRVRFYLCPSERRTLPFAFPDQSLIVMGGERGWWPTQTARWRRHLESAGHLVLFVGAEPRQEDRRA